MRPERKLPIPVARVLSEPPPGRARDMWADIQAVRRARRTRSWARGTLIAAVGLMLGVLAILPRTAPTSPAGQQVLTLAGGASLPKHIEPREPLELPLSDGSRLRVGRAAQLDLLELSSTRVALALRAGRARFDIRPHGPRAWKIDCGAVMVEVVGTAFELERSAGAVEVRVLRGAVLVRGPRVPDSVQRLEGGQYLRVAAIPSAEPSSLVVPRAPATSHASPSIPARAQREVGAERPSREVVGSPRVASKIGRGAAPASQGSLTEAPPALEELLRAADHARRAGRPRAAIGPLDDVVTRYPTSPSAALAAFELARLRLDVLDEPALAVDDLQRALALGPPAAIIEDVRARLVEAYGRAGQSEAACLAAQAYRAAFPRGRREGILVHFCPHEHVDP